MSTCGHLVMGVLYPARDYNADTPQKRFLRFLRVMQVCHSRNSSPKNFAYGTQASLEEDGQTFFAVCLHCNPVLAKKRSSLNRFQADIPVMALVSCYE